MLLHTGLALLQVLAEPAAADPGVLPITAAAATPDPVADFPAPDEATLLFFDTRLKDFRVADSLTAYGNPEQPLLPLGDLARRLDLLVDVDAGAGFATGTIGEERRSFALDLKNGIARFGGQTRVIDPAQVAIAPGDIFVRTDLFTALTGVRFDVDTRGLIINLSSDEVLPVQARRARAQRRGSLGAFGSGNTPVFRAPTPYRLFSKPSIDVILQGGPDSRQDNVETRYDFRAAGDLLGLGYSAYVGSDENGNLEDARFVAERRSLDGGLLGPLDATYFGGGDVFTPTLTLGPRSVGGRGIAITSEDLTEASVFQTVNLRGELPIGFDVELYVNDVLRQSQAIANEGRYEFRDIPLQRGLNVIRIVVFGPRGERSETTRVINVGGGQVAEGDFTYNLGVVQQNTPLFGLDPDFVGTFGSVGSGDLRAVAEIKYGISEALTVVAGASSAPDQVGERRETITAGLRTSLFGMATQVDAAHQPGKGTAALVGVAGEIAGMQTLAQHTEYFGDFYDETVRFTNLARVLSRRSEATFSFSIGGEDATRQVPISLRFARDAFSDGTTSLFGLARASTTIGSTFTSAGFDYRSEGLILTPGQETLRGFVTAQRFLNLDWQLRGNLNYLLLPDTELESFSVSVDRVVSEQLALTGSIGRAFNAGTTSIDATASWRLPFADLQLSGDYLFGENDWRIAARVAFGFAYDPVGGRYRMTPPGAAEGASAVFRSFIDTNANGIMDEGEEPVPDIRLQGGREALTTGPDGTTFVTGLAAQGTSRLRADTSEIDAFFVSTPPTDIDFEGRPGLVAVIDYPLTPISEAYLRVTTTNQAGREIGLSAVRLLLTPVGGGDPFEGLTEYDGSLVFTELPPGRYEVSLDPAQKERLGVLLESAPVLEVSSEEPAELDLRILFTAQAEAAE
ncbi:MAG: hypothetical protein V2J26_09130 [Pacificimonas sp.]|jgi:hypothetical protein|nr:hypothetical protein [Pacificimonas sp.]